MNLYKVMLVDDEEEVREAMKRRIDWESIGFTVVASAENGEDALDKAEIYEPDVVLTDIQMPFMDGLTMLKNLKNIIPDIRSVILSGYDEFEYAKEAIKLEAEEYILKPIDSEELKKVFERIKARLDEQVSNNKDYEKLRQYYDQSIDMFRQQVLIGLLEGRQAETDLKLFQEKYSFSVESAFYCVGVFALDDPEDNTEKLNKTMMTISLKQIVEERFEGKIKILAINYLDTIVVLARLKSTAEGIEFEKEMDRICKIAGKLFGVNVVAGLGRIYGNADGIHTSFLEAKDASYYRMFMDSNQALCITDVEPLVNIDDYVEESQIRHIMRELKVGTKESIETEVRDFIGRLKNKSISLKQLYFFYTEFLVELSKLIRGHRIEDLEKSILNINAGEEMAGFSSLDSLGDRILELCLPVYEKLNSQQKDNTRKLAEDAKQYISDHYKEAGLSVEDICLHLGVGASYFSSVFKKNTGVSFVTYLTQVRMNEAKRLLDTTDEKSYVISGMVGYDEPNYFSYVFKKQFGVSPSKYRQKD